METPDSPRSCPLCALPRMPVDAAGLAWSSRHAPDGTVWYVCPTCTRAQLWRIETMLAVAAPGAAASPAPVRRAA